MEASQLFLIAAVLTTGFFCQWIAWRMKIPAILPLLLVGLAAGPDVLGILRPQEMMGNLFFPFVSLSVSIILFEGALTLNLQELRTVGGVVRNLLVIGSLVTWFGAALAARLLLPGFTWAMALLFGSLIIVTGPTVIAPLLRNVRPNATIESILKWEGILIDPLGALVAVLVFEWIVAGTGTTVAQTAGIFAKIVSIGAAFGFGAARLLYAVLQRYLIPDYLRDFAILASVILVFSASNMLAPESGLLAVTVMGITLANTDLKQLREIFYFKEKISILLISTLFILLAANITRQELSLLDWRSLLILVIVIFILRPLGIYLSALGSSLTRNERLFLSWIAPRGIVAAAISSLFAFELNHLDSSHAIAGAEFLTPLTFMVIVGTVFLQGSTAKRWGQYLDISEADPQGFLLMGGYRLTAQLAPLLVKQGLAVKIIDTNFENVMNAKRQGLDAVHGNILSEFLETNLHLSSIGRLLAFSRNDEANALACKHLEDEFGSSQVFQLPPRTTRHESEQLGRTQLGRVLFRSDATYDIISDWLNRGATIQTVELTTEYSYNDLLEEHDDFIVLLVKQNGDFHVVTAGETPNPVEGSTLFVLMFDT